MQQSRIEPPNESWIATEDIPDPSPLPRPQTFHLLIRPVRINEDLKTKGGIILTDTTKSDVQYLMNVGRIVAAGPSAFVDTDALHSGHPNPYGKFGDKTTVPRVGDFVMWPKNTGTKIKIKGVTLVIIADDEVILSVDSLADINPVDNLSRY